ncbi:N-acetylmuramoyl-L-alanine amidase, family 4 [Lentilactobacillus kosonis]|uniref:N-acetylmuramoyl-L-alanine amidase, family 4 n=1 Tax=Lentilactobacillus kosonis TaxID=2810561 RepID=A0A401FK74_9LACO|nr:N-acetylmuramoyl-L-alanine amidase, family 4 [Lentilactobacillus kosonis]
MITLIQQYNLDQTFSETGNGGSGSNNSNSDNSGSNSSNSGSNSSNSGSNSSNLNDTGTNDGSAANPGAKPLDTAKYTSADPNQMVLLSPTFNKYYAYNHVKGTSAKEKRYSFKSLKVTKPVWVYLDMKAKKRELVPTGIELDFNKNQKHKFWVYSPVLAFPETFYNTNSGSITVDSKSNADIYNHVYGSDYLAKSMGKISKLQENVNYVVDGEAIVDNSQGELWYRIKFNGTSGWIKSSEIKSYTANVVYVKVKLNKKLASTVKSGYAYNHVPNTTGVKRAPLKRWELQIKAN